MSVLVPFRAVTVRAVCTSIVTYDFVLKHGTDTEIAGKARAHVCVTVNIYNL